MSTRSRQILRKVIRHLNSSSSSVSDLTELADTISFLGDSLVHTAVYMGHESSLQTVISNIPSNERLNIYLLRNSNGLTPLEESVSQKSERMCSFILESLQDDDERLLLLQSQNQRGWTALHRAVYVNCKDNDGKYNKETLKVLSVLLKSVKRDLRGSLASIKNVCGCNILLQSLFSSNHHIFKCILRALSTRDRLSLLTCKDEIGNTLLHNIILKANAELLQWTIQREKSQQTRLQLLKTTDEEGRTLLQIAAENSNFKAVEYIVDLLDTGEEKFDMLWATDNKKQTALHYAARSKGSYNVKKTKGLITGNAPTIIDLMLRAVKPNERAMLLIQPDCNGNTALNEAMRINNTKSIRTITQLLDPVGLDSLRKQTNIPLVAMNSTYGQAKTDTQLEATTNCIRETEDSRPVQVAETAREDRITKADQLPRGDMVNHRHEITNNLPTAINNSPTELSSPEMIEKDNVESPYESPSIKSVGTPNLSQTTSLQQSGQHDIQGNKQWHGADSLSSVEKKLCETRSPDNISTQQCIACETQSTANKPGKLTANYVSDLDSLFSEQQDKSVKCLGATEEMEHLKEYSQTSQVFPAELVKEQTTQDKPGFLTVPSSSSSSSDSESTWYDTELNLDAEFINLETLKMESGIDSSGGDKLVAEEAEMDLLKERDQSSCAAANAIREDAPSCQMHSDNSGLSLDLNLSASLHCSTRTPKTLDEFKG